MVMPAGGMSASGGSNEATTGDLSSAVGRNEGITFGSRTQATDGSTVGTTLSPNTLMFGGIGLLVYLILSKKKR